jgi:hypothetical protein
MSDQQKISRAFRRLEHMLSVLLSHFHIASFCYTPRKSLRILDAQITSFATHMEHSDGY